MALLLRALARHRTAATRARTVGTDASVSGQLRIDRVQLTALASVLQREHVGRVPLPVPDPAHDICRIGCASLCRGPPWARTVVQSLSRWIRAQHLDAPINQLWEVLGFCPSPSGTRH